MFLFPQENITFPFVPNSSYNKKKTIVEKLGGFVAAFFQNLPSLLILYAFPFDVNKD